MRWLSARSPGAGIRRHRPHCGHVRSYRQLCHDATLSTGKRASACSDRRAATAVRVIHDACVEGANG
jgi:hypothetical protein